MKLRFIISVLILSLIFSLSGCGSTKQTTTTPTNSQPTTQTQQQQFNTKASMSSQTATPPATTSTTTTQTEKKDVTVYATKTGEKYHRAGCSSLSKSQIPMSLSDAKAAGYTPCSKCNPPQ